MIIAKGKYEPPAGGGRHEINIYGPSTTIRAGAAGTPFSGGGGSGSLEHFMLAVGRYHNRRIINEVEAPANGQIVWRYRIPDGVSKEDAAKESVLTHVSQQTGIVFSEERANVVLLMVERAELE